MKNKNMLSIIFRRRTFFLLGMLLAGGMASAQVVIEGNVYGGGNIGEVVKTTDGTGNTTVTVNGGTIGDTLRLKHRVADKQMQVTTRVDYGNVYGGGNGYLITGHNPNNNAPIFDINAGRVQGNTNVTIQGNAVVRRAVYGGGNMASVGMYSANNGVATYTSGGHTVVTVTGNALIGPKKTDLTSPTRAELESVKEFYHMTSLMSASQYADSAFKYLGANEGWVFGSSRGISGGALRDYSFVDTTEVTISGNAQVLNVFGSGENGHVQKGTNVIVGGNALVGGVPLHGAGQYTVPASGITSNTGEYKDAIYTLATNDSETAEDEFGVGREIPRGNVLGGGKGTDFISWFANPKFCYTSGRVYGNTHVTVQDNALIYNRVYGGGLIAMVGTFTEEDSSDPDNHTIIGIASGGHTYVNINGGFIGSPGSNGHNNGEVYGGSRGLPGRPRKMVSGALETLTPLHQVVDEAYVGHTHVTVDGGTVMNSVYGGGANGHVQGNTYVTIKETDSNKRTTIGLEGVGGWHGNVYAGGGGTDRYTERNAKKHSITAGRVFGNTNLNITGGSIKHNVYGGGALASVGTYLKYNGVEQAYFGGGKATLNITGGTIGTNGDNNGMVFGSGRGEIMAPDQIMDTLTYMAYTFVNIGKNNNGTYEGDAKINGSVYGSGENGHVYLESKVNVYSGTIGCTAQEYAAMSEEDKVNKFPYRGNVYGAGCGTDKFDSDNNGVGDTYNPNTGYVWGQTEVNIYGGYISRSVYGAGAMGSVGLIDHTRTKKHLYINHETEPSLSWPYELTYSKITDSLNRAYPSGDALTGKSTVNVFGGHIGTLAAPVAECGNVFGSARGDVGPLGVMDTLAIVRETEVNVNFTPSSGAITDATPNVIIGSVYGSGENGTVYENTKVTLTNGLVRGSVFGGGDGTDTYMVALKDPNNPSSYLDPSPQRSITSGKVYGNTEVVISGGQVLHNVFGGGNLASVGKGSYMGYGEMSGNSTTPITPTEEPYENSGICTVTVTGGTIGTTGYPGDGYNNGFVFGSSKGTPFKTVNLNPRYDYSRDFFLGYVNKTIVNIGDPDANVTTGPTIKGSVFGGGDNGHVRWHTYVNVNKGEIGEAYVVPAQYPEADSVMKWVYRGNVYGAGRGTDMYDSDGNGSLDSYCPSAGSVTLNTNVTVNGGTIHRNVYGGGSMATVGPPPTGYNPGTSTCTVNIFGGAIGEVVSSGAAAGSLYGGNVYGAGRGIIDQLAPLTQYAAASNTEVNVEIGNATDKVIGNVYGGGSYGQVKKETNVNMKAGLVEGSVFGGGMGFETEVIAGLVAGNATVDMTGGTIERSIYGGGQMGSVGTFLTYNDVTYNAGQSNAFTVQVPKTCAENTGLTTVKMSGGNVGLLGSLMPWEDHNPDDDDRGWIFCGGQGLGDSITYPKAIAMGVVGSTYLEIKNTSTESTTIRPLVTASVYGGCENGLVLNDTHVKIMGGQIGTGHYKTGNVHHFDPMYDDDDWAVAIAAVQSGDETAINNAADRFHECDAWEYGIQVGEETKYYVYDIYAEANGHPNNNNNPDNPDYHTASLQGTNGHSFFGNVFGGGSGYYPIAPGVWRRSAGQVNGNTHVEITGGHILTSVYGGNETTDVKGKCTIEMSGGTLGVPRTIDQIKGHPVTCYLFGAGMGDTRTQFNKWTHVGNVEVSITGGTIFGSVFGGGEDGHVLGDVDLTVGGDAWVGTWGRSYVDGNVFGGGRGFSGHALTAGVVMGNVDVNISGGTMLGSIYGGGRLASVGTRLVEPNSPQYGQLIPDSGDDTHGHVTINITGGTIGNDYEAIYHTDFKRHTTGGHVFAGAMGRLTNLDNSTNSLWPNLGKVKETVVNISGNNTLIKGNVYGGGEFGTVETDATITVSGGTIMRDVYGGGYGSTDITSIGQLRVPNGSSVTLIDMTPMKLAGRVNGNTKINVEGGWIQKSVYGGGEMATVGVIKNDSVAHRSETTEFALSWPYKMNYEANTGKTEINVTGGRIGITGSDYMGPYAMINGQLTPVKYNDQGNPVALTETEIDDAKEDNGDVYGGGKGFAAQRYLEAHANNVHDTHITVNYASNSATPTNYKDKENGVYTHDCITGAVYGGGENGHVIQNSNITLTNGLVGHNIYGGGKGKGTFKTDLWKIGTPTTNPPDSLNVTVYSITAGKVYGNTYVTMNGGYVVRNVYGGGNMASVGKGNYTGAPDDYSTTGYGECVTTASAMADTLNSGNTFVTITGGQLGYLNPSNPDKVIKDGLPYGSVYGGCRGEVQRDVPRTLTPRILYSPEDFLGYVNKTHVVIGSATGSGTGPRLYGSVYGGGQDGHVRWNTNIAFNKGEIGVDFGGSEKIANDETIQNDPNSPHWTNRGNVYGAGSGIGQYTDANNVKQYSYISGSVTQFTNVEIKGGTIHNNVYGGGNLATVGPPRILQTVDCPADKTGVTVNIKGNAEIGKNTNQNAQYGGKVYGASRGIASEELGTDNKPKYKDFAYCSYTEVNVSESPVIYGAVFGGGENGKVGLYHEDRTSHVENGQNIHTSTVNITGGTIKHSVYGGGQGVFGDVISGSSPVAYYVNDTMSGRVMGNATVNLMGGTIGVDDGNYAANVYGGCRRSFVWGNTLVNVGNRVPNREDPEPGTEPDPDPYTYYGNLTIFGSIFGANRYNGTPYGDATVNVYKTAHTADNKYPPIPEGLNTDEEILAWLGTLPHNLNNFAIEAAFGGSDLVDYTPRAGKKATVNVFQCDENTICDVYGGGNAAAIGSANAGYQTDANVHIYGGRFYRVFGGGNGEVSPADVYGTANTTIDGGLIYSLFGGGNSQGTVNATNLVINENGDCPLYINNIFGGGNIAPIIGDVVTTVECGEGSYDNFYGGSNFADIYGNVTVNIFGGTYNRLFGGSRGSSDDGADIRSFPSYAELLADYNLPVEERQYSQSLRDYMHFDPTDNTGFATELVGEGGNVTTNLFGGTVNVAAFGGSHIKGVIDGKIQVNVFDASNCGLDLEDLYGAGCDTPYEPIYALGQGETIRLSPEVNIIHGTVKGNVFGGGQGLTANTVGTNPVINMGYYDTMGSTSIEGSLIDRLVDTVADHHYTVPQSYTAQVGRNYSDSDPYNGKGNIYGGGELAQVKDSTFVYIHDGRVIGSVYGGGRGQSSVIVNEADTVAGCVRGNTLVDMSGGLVERSIYGGGELGSVGTFTEFYTTATGEHVAGEPKKCKSNTGLARVLISGGQVGKNDAFMPTTLHPHNDEYGYVFCGGKGVVDSLTYPMANLLAVVDRTYLEISNTTSGETIVKSPVVTASIYGGSKNGLVLGNTHVKMTGGQIGTGYNESSQQHDGLYSESQWNDVIQKIKNGTFTDADANSFHECDHWPYGRDTNNDDIPDTFEVYDIFANLYDSHGGALAGSNGHTFFGNVFGGGSGFYPLWDDVNDTAVWRRSAGRVWGNTLVEIEGGHILTSVYGANEVSDVMGKATINMTGGTIGVPRTIASIKAHPVTCYLFGAGMGDPRIMFNTWTNVANAEVNISDNAFLFGSAFGGGEDGHVLGNVTMNIGSSENPSSDHVHIGTWGYSYVDGNVFGGGRGFDGNALTAGSVGGNVTLNIYSGNILGSVYGGGRLASVGCGFTAPDDDNYGQMRAGDNHGNVHVNISGGTIGNDYESMLHVGNPALANGHSYGGNVYGGSMGRLTLLNGDVNELWPNLGKVKNTFVTISGSNTIIKGSVYGGSELGTLSSNAEDVAADRVSGRAFVKVEDGTIWRNVFGGSYGSDNTTMLAPLDVQTQETPYMVSPMQRAGRIDGNTKVEIKGGWVKKGVYGGGELASVGTIIEEPVKHENETQCFALSWPYEFKYQAKTGIDTVLVTGGRIGLTGKDYMGPWNSAGEPIYYAESDENQLTPIKYDLTTTAGADALKEKREDNGDVYGGGKGKAGDRYTMAHCANSSNTVVIVEYPSTSTATPANYKPAEDSPLYLGTIGGKVYDFVYRFIPTYNYNIPNLPEQSEQWLTYHNRGCLPGSLYGGGENGHVNDKARVTFNKGLVGHSIYGGGKGSDTYKTLLNKIDPETGEPMLDGNGHPIQELKEITSITAGKVYGNTYVTMNGGYVVRSVFGGGNRASVGKGNYAGGPGDFTPAGYGEQWTSDNMYLRDTLVTYSGHAYVNINGGQIGTVNGMKDGLPTGNVYGSSRGEPAPNVRQTLHPRILYYPEFFLGYVNHTHVTIGKENETGAGPRLYGSVFGGGEDGHVRWSTEVTVNKGEIGNKYDAATQALVGTSDLTDYQWRGRGSVHGAGAGLGMYKDANNQEHFSTSAGSVTQFTKVTINGGIIHQNVYGGGPLSSVGPPAMGQSTVPSTDYSLAKVNIHSAIGDPDVVKQTEQNQPASIGAYGGSVFGASRGVFNFDADPSLAYDKFATTMFTEVNIYDGADIPGSVYGGGQLGQVKNDTKVNMLGGTVGTIEARKASGSEVYTSYEHTSGGKLFGGGAGYPVSREAALVKGNTEVNISGGHVLLNVYGGGEVASVGVRDTIFDGEVHDAAHIKDYAPKANTGYAKVTITGGQVGPAPKVEEGYNIPIGLNGVDGYVFGGGKGVGDDVPGVFKEFADVNYTAVTVDIPSDADQTTNRIWGSIFGGAEDGHVLGSDTVRLVNGLVGTYGTTGYDGNIFGGGRNYSKKNYTAGRTRGNITVEMTGGQLLGCLFGGGRLALTGIGYNGVNPTGTSADAYKALLDGPEHGQVSVKVTGGTVGNLDHMRDSQFAIGDVYGGGKGSKTGIASHPASSAMLISLVKDTEVEISGTARIYGSVYGGGEVSNVGNFTWNQSGANVSNIAIASGTGHTKVAVSGGTIGLDNMQMITASGYPDDFGHVFGGCEGWVEKLDDSPVIDEEGDRLVELMASVGTTEVTIKDNAFVLGSVYGGADNGHVLDSTWVKIQGGQIGAGQGYTIPYNDDDWASSALAPTAHWDYTMNGNPYDIFVLEGGKPKPGLDGGTFFGNVFGGGSGYYPYESVGGQSQWLRSAGQVRGNTRVEVTGGHILSCLYGGCEVTNVGMYTYNNTIHGEDHNSGGKATVVMSGGTIGVPRSTTDIQNLPVPGYLYGSGKGDPRIYFNTWTNVWETDVTVSGGRIYGCVFGGGEDAHVMGDVNLKVSQASSDVPTIIGTQGLTKADGNVFGAGRGTTEEALTAGSVSGNVNVNITGGTILNSVYGGGNRASVGTYLVDRLIPGTETLNEYYGQMREDETGDDAQTYGHVVVNVSGGTVVGNGSTHPSHVNPYTMSGNVYGGGRGVISTVSESIWPLAARVKQTNVTIKGTAAIKNSVYGGGEVGSVRDSTTVNIAGNCTIGGVYTNNNVAENCGHVFGGGRGYEGANTAESLNTNNALHEPTILIAGRVYGDSYVNIKGGHVFENVFGGGEVASVGRFNIVYNNPSDLSLGASSVTPVANTGKATVKVTGGIIGPLDNTGLNGYVFGGPKGGRNSAMKPYCNVNHTEVEVGYNDSDANRVWGSLFGGGSDGHVLGNATVTMKKGTLGTNGITGFDGNIFGGGRNYHEESETAGRVGGNTTVNVLGGHMLGSVFGGGRLGSVGIDVNGDTLVGVNHGYATVNVGGQYQIGNIDIGHVITDPTQPDERVGGNVYGGAKGKADAPGTMATRLSKVKQTTVNIMEKSGTETWIEGSVFGSGEDGHVLKDTYVNIHGGQIGGHDYGDLEPCNDPYHGNVYGGGRGVDTYEHEGAQIHSHTAGLVQGNTHVTMDGGHVIRNVYGGGNLASVGNANEPDPAPGEDYKTGLASVTITGGTVGTIHEDENFGNVFGSGHGGVGGEYVDLAFVKNTHVTIGGGANTRVFGSVFGGGEDGHVRMNTLVDIEGGIIGDEDDVANEPLDGNVYGGGRGLLATVESETAGEVRGHTTVNIRKSTDGVTEYSPIVWNNVYGGGSQSVVKEYKVVNMSGGLVHGSVFGGSREIPASRPNMAPRWVNMWGGTVEGNVYGCSYYAEDGAPANDEDWASFVNISGGTIGTNSNGGIEGGNVYGAGYGGKVKGSVAVLIGKNAIVETSNELGDEFYNKNIHRQETPAVANLDIKGSVFGGSYGSIGSTDWDHSFNVSGYSRIYIDGTGYNTTISAPAQSTTNYMNIGGGVYGCGTNCESGEEGRNILVRNYGTRNPEGNSDAELTQASRTLTTLQRGDIIMLDNTNVNLSGADDISQSDSERKFAVLQVDNGVYVTNASGIVLGAVGAPAYMDSIHEVRSLHLKDNSTTSYLHMNAGNDNSWEWIGVNPLNPSDPQGNTQENASLYYRQTNPSTPLAYNQENVIIFKGDSRLYVRYLDESGSTKIRKYGQLQGFFRMRGDLFQPYGTESFAYARPKVTPKNNPIAVDGYNFTSDILNGSDGGFLSYVTDYNFFTQANHEVLNYTYHYEGDDGGSEFTKTKQYPYFNIGEYVPNRESGEMDLEEFREWVLPVISGKIWYVDGRGIGTGGWGKDRNHQEGWGHFPDKPKLTVSGNKTITVEGNTILEQGICYDESITPEAKYPAFDNANDIIYVVGPIEAVLENDNLNRWPDYQLKLYRYPGGHIMSNNQYDETKVVDAEHPVEAPTETPGQPYNGLLTGETAGPGANLGMMIHANKSNFVMENVLVDGLYNPSQSDVTTHNIPTSFTRTQMYNVNKPMVVVDTVGNPSKQSSLTLKGFRTTTNVSGETEVVTNGTILQRGYNGIDAATTWYYDADYDCYTESTSGDQQVITVTPQGGGLFVDKDATSTVNVEGLVTIQGNKQRHVVGSDDHPVNCNVYLPTFSKHLNITDELEKETHIGVTSPIRNTAEWYYDNTFSPVAEAVPAATATMEAKEIASQAWQNCNFNDDQGWFFVNENVEKLYINESVVNHRRTTYYDERATTSIDGTETIINPTNPNLNENTLFFGWTWANVVRAKPGTDSFKEENDGSTTTFNIKDEKGLAWLISMTSGMNGVGYSSTNFSSNSQHPKFIKQTDVIDLKQYVWVPIGSPADGNHKQFAGNYDGQGHLIKNLYIEYIGVGDSIYERHDYGLFGNTYKANVNRTFLVSGKVSPVIPTVENTVPFNPSIDAANTFNVGGLVGYQEQGDVTNSEAAVEIICPDKNGSGIIGGGLVAKVEAGVVHSSMAMPVMGIGASSTGPMGGLVGNASDNSSIENSFVNATFNINQSNQSVKAAGLLGRANGMEMKNCYSHMRNELTSTSVFKGIINQFVGTNDIDYCYVEQGYTFANCGEHSDNYTYTTSPDNLGYMYYDNIIENDTTLVARLNINAWSMNPASDSTYAHWARPGLAEINGDLPVLLLCEFDADSIYQGNFRSVGTYEGGRALQYGGPVRDDNELDSALTRALEKDEHDQDIPDYLFVYGDVKNVGSSLAITQSKVSYHEDVSILNPGKLSDFANNYVGITFDNSCGHASSSPGINEGLIGTGGYLLPRDWHMFSTPLSNAPLGFDYKGDNEASSPHYNNPWESTANEFNWLNGGYPNGNNRYWMKDYDVADGYFPTRLDESVIPKTDDLFIVNSPNTPSDECPSSGVYRYPYGMDFYTWNEPQYHWINFKRNGPNHWHSDTPHVKLDYVTEVATNHEQTPTNVNEETLISGKGYMAAITKETFMQSHGYLNGDMNSITLKNTSGSKMPGWNLVGNPYHGYLDFDELAKGTNLQVLSDQYYGNPDEQRVFYVVYNADKYDGEVAGTAFRYYPVRGSRGGDYAERYLHPHQAFYVKAKDTKPLRFKGTMLATRASVAKHGEESHLREDRPAYPLVNLYLSSDQGCADVTVIEFERPNWGGAIKMKELRVGDGVFYAQHDNTHYAALFAQQGIDRVPLWFEAKEDDIFNIKWNTANGDFQSMYLIDNLTGVQYDMLRNNSYTFEGHKGDYPSRFLIVFNVTDVEEHIELNSFVFFDGSQWLVTGDGELQFSDLNGQVLWEKEVHGGQTRITVPEVASGMYLFRLTNGKETKVQKVIVNR